MTAQEQPYTATAPSLWIGLFAGPSAFLLELQINYMLVPWACSTGNHSVLQLVVIAALALAVVGGIAAFRARRLYAGEPALSYARFMAGLGSMLSALSFLLIVAQGVPAFILNPCTP